MENNEVLKIATKAIDEMFQKNGPDFKFPFDVIWQYGEGHLVPSTSRPHQVRPLLKDGYIEKTGALTKAATEKRAGSATPEYRFGAKFLTANSISKNEQKIESISAYLDLMQQTMEADGYIISSAELANFYLAMAASPLVILSGISGTGKSLLPRSFAKHTKAKFLPIPVQPQWSDNSDLFGYTPTLNPSSFVEGRFIQALREAKASPDTLVVVLLDEMNLAPVEHYFSDFLSVMETRTRRDGKITTDFLPINLPEIQAGHEDKFWELRQSILPNNIRIVGTANMDETTRTFSPKILDRAFAIEFDDPDLTAFAAQGKGNPTHGLSALAAAIVNQNNAISIHEAIKSSQDLFEYIAALLEEIQSILRPVGITFGYRTRDAILLYLHYWKEMSLHNILNDNAALDFCLLQKILPKVGGTGSLLGEALESLSSWLGRDRRSLGEANKLGFNGPFTRSQEKVERMKNLLENNGSTYYWGV